MLGSFQIHIGMEDRVELHFCTSGEAANADRSPPVVAQEGPGVRAIVVKGEANHPLSAYHFNNFFGWDTHALVCVPFLDLAFAGAVHRDFANGTRLQLHELTTLVTAFAVPPAKSHCRLPHTAV